jgi:hypothetical protein
MAGEPGDFRAQAIQAFENVKAALQSSTAVYVVRLARDGALFELDATAILAPA